VEWTGEWSDLRAPWHIACR